MAYNLQPSYPNTDALETRDKAIAVQYGRTADGTIIPISVDSSGRLVLGSGITLDTDNIDIGDVVIKGTSDAAQTLEERIGVTPSTGLPAGRFSMLVEDPRMNFTGGALQITSEGSGEIFASTATVLGATFADLAPVFDVTGFRTKSFILENTSPTADIEVQGFASFDGGVTYPIPLLAASTLGARGS